MELNLIDYDRIKYNPKSDEEIRVLKELYKSGSLALSSQENASGFLEKFPQIQYLSYVDILILKKRNLYNFYYKDQTFWDRFNACYIISDDDSYKITDKQKITNDLNHMWEDKTTDNFIPLALIMQDTNLKPAHWVKFTEAEYKLARKYIREHQDDMTSSWFCDLTDSRATHPEYAIIAEQYSDLLYIYMNLA